MEHDFDTQPDPPLHERKIPEHSGRRENLPSPDPLLDEADTQEDIVAPETSNLVDGPPQPFDFDKSFGLRKLLDESSSQSQQSDHFTDPNIPDDNITQDITQDVTQDVTQDMTQELNADTAQTASLTEPKQLRSSQGDADDTQSLPNEGFPDTQIIPVGQSTPAKRRSQKIDIPDTQQLPSTDDIPDTQLMPSSSPSQQRNGNFPDTQVLFPDSDQPETSPGTKVLFANGRSQHQISRSQVIEETPDVFDMPDTQVLATPVHPVRRHTIQESPDGVVMETPLNLLRESVIQVPHSQEKSSNTTQKRHVSSILGNGISTDPQGSPMIGKRRRTMRMPVVDESDDEELSDEGVADSQPGAEKAELKRANSSLVPDTQDLNAPKQHNSTSSSPDNSQDDEEYRLPSESSLVTPSPEKKKHYDVTLPDVIPESLNASDRSCNYLTVWAVWGAKYYPAKIALVEGELIFIFPDNESASYLNSTFKPLVLPVGLEVVVRGSKNQRKGNAVIVAGVPGSSPTEDSALEDVATMDGFRSFEVKFKRSKAVEVVELSRISLSKKQYESLEIPDVIYKADLSFAFPDEVKNTEISSSSIPLSNSLPVDTQVLPTSPKKNSAWSPPARRQDTSRRLTSISNAHNVPPNMDYLRTHSVILPPAIQDSSDDQAMFDGCIFLMTFTEDYATEKKRLKDMISAGGGTIYEDFVSLFKWDNGDPTIDAKALRKQFGCVISNSHARTPKYLQALAMGWPCLHCSFVDDVVSGVAVLDDWKAYLLPRGQVDFGLCCMQDIFDFNYNWSQLKSQQGQLSTVFLKRHDLHSLYLSRKTVLSDILATFVITGTEYRDQLIRVLVHAQNPSYVEAVFSREEFEDAVKEFSIGMGDVGSSAASKTVLVLNLHNKVPNADFESAVRNFKERFPWANIVLADRDWFVQSIVTGRLRQMIQL